MVVLTDYTGKIELTRHRTPTLDFKGTIFDVPPRFTFVMGFLDERPQGSQDVKPFDGKTQGMPKGSEATTQKQSGNTTSSGLADSFWAHIHGLRAYGRLKR